MAREAKTAVTTELIRSIEVGASMTVKLNSSQDIRRATNTCYYASEVHGEVEGWRISVIRDSKLKTLTIKKIKR